MTAMPAVRRDTTAFSALGGDHAVGRERHRDAAGAPRRISLARPWYLLPMLVACTGSVTDPPVDAQTTVLEIVTDREAYARGGTGVVLVTNKSMAQVIVAALCAPVVDRWDGSVWQEADTDPVAATCLPVSRLLRPGQGAQSPFALAPDLARGYYRLRFENLSDSAAGLLPEAERVSRSFQIR